MIYLGKKYQRYKNQSIQNNFILLFFYNQEDINITKINVSSLNVYKDKFLILLFVIQSYSNIKQKYYKENHHYSFIVQDLLV